VSPEYVNAANILAVEVRNSLNSQMLPGHFSYRMEMRLKTNNAGTAVRVSRMYIWNSPSNTDTTFQVTEIAQTLSGHTVFVRSDNTATIYFITQFCAASIREWLLFESGVY